MKKALIIFTSIFLIFTIFSVSAISWSSGVIPRNLTQLNDVSIVSPTQGQILNYDSSSSMWINQFLNSILTLQPSSYLFFSANNEITFNESNVNATGDLRYWNIDGDNATGIYNVDGSMNVSNYTGINMNLSGNLIVQDRLAVGFTSLPRSALNPGDGVFNGNVIANGTGVFFAPDKGNALDAFNNGVADPSQSALFFNFSGSLNSQTKIFCDELNDPFVPANQFRTRISVLFSAEFITAQIPMEINEFINDSCALMNLAAFGDTPSDLTSVSYVSLPSAIFSVVDNSAIFSQIGNSSDAVFQITANLATGEENLFVKITAGARNVVSSIIRGDANGQNDMTNFVSLMTSSQNVTGTVQRNTILSADLANYQGGEYTGLMIELLNPGVNVTTTGLELSSTLTSLIRVGQLETVGNGFYDNTTDIINITNQINNSEIITPLFQENGSVLYLGNTKNFTQIPISVIPGTNSIVPTFFYCNSSSEYQEFNVSDGTDGFTHSGTIIFNNPSNRGTCNIELDGTPLPDLEPMTYIAIQRNEENLLITPNVSLINIFISSSRFLIGNDGTMTGGQRAFGFVNTETLPAGSTPFYVKGFNSDGEEEVFFATQNGRNESGSIIRDTLLVFSTDNYTQSEKTNLTFLHNSRERWEKIGIDSILPYDSDGIGADLAIEHGIETRLLVLHDQLLDGGLEGAGTFDFNLRGEASFINNSVRNLIPVNFTAGFLPGDLFTIVTELFLGDLGIFSNNQSNILNWIVVSDILCEDGLCAKAQGNGGAVVMQTSFSTLNVNQTDISFFYALDRIIGSDEFNVYANNNTGSGNVLIFTDAGTVGTTFANITLDNNFWNQTLINITVECDATNINRFCFFDTFVANGTFTANTTANVNSFDAEFCASPNRGTDGRCVNSLYFSAEDQLWFATPGINGTGGGGSGVTGSGTTNSITKWAGSTTLTDANIVDTGSLITLGSNTVITGDVNSTGFFRGLFNWTTLTDWLSFDGATLSFNETKLNESIIEVASVYNNTDLILWEEIGNNITLKNLSKNIDIGNMTFNNKIRSSEFRSGMEVVNGGVVRIGGQWP